MRSAQDLVKDQKIKRAVPKGTALVFCAMCRLLAPLCEGGLSAQLTEELFFKYNSFITTSLEKTPVPNYSERE